MNHVPRARAARAAAWTATLALIGASAVGLAAGPAGAATAKKGSLQVCASSSTSSTVHFTLHRTGWTKHQTLRTRAGHTACASAVAVKAGSYQVAEAAAHGTHVSKIHVSPTARGSSAKPKTATVRTAVAARHTTRATFANVRTATPAPPVTTPPPTTTPPTTPSDPGTGYLEVCKAAGDGYVTGNVTVAIADGAFSKSQVVPVGQCTGPIQVPVGSATITETAPAPYYLDSVRTNPASALVSVDSAANSAVVSVAASTDGSTETTATLVNKAHLGYYKICKTLTANSGDLVATGNNTFAFDVAYTAVNSPAYRGTVSVVVPTLNDPACVLSGPVPLGTVVSITEEAAANTTLQGVTVQPAGQAVSISGRTAVVKVGPNTDGTVTAAYTNSADGTLEICKNIDDGYWSGGPVRELVRTSGSPYNGTPFRFSVNGGSPITVRAGACSAPLSVPAGTATVQELATPNFNLEGFTATGPDGSNRITSGTNPITVTVPAGGAGNETLVIATNRVQTAQLKVCKILDGVPVGKSYHFTTRFGIGSYGFSEDTVLQPTDEGTAGEVCGYLSRPLPVIDGSGHSLQVSVTEGTSPFGIADNGTSKQLIVEPTVISYDGNGSLTGSKVAKVGDPISDDGTYYGCAVLGQGVNVITFTNSYVIDP